MARPTETGSRPSDQAPSGLDASRFDPARVERLAINLRAYAYAMGAPRRDTDEEVALGAARLILPVLESQQ